MAYPKLIIDALKLPMLAENIWHAQMAGYPKVLTYKGGAKISGVSGREANRYKALHTELNGKPFEIPRIASRDEYPFNCTEEGGSVWVGHIPPSENSAQGGLIAQMLRRHNILPGQGDLSKFEVEVINYRHGPVTN